MIYSNNKFIIITIINHLDIFFLFLFLVLWQLYKVILFYFILFIF